MKSILLTLILVMCFQSLCSAQQLDNDLGEALSKLDEGTVLLEQHNHRSDVLLGEAAAMLAKIIDEQHHETPGIYHALGNAYMLKGDLGHAVLAYRKGEQLDPTHTPLRESLDHARSMVPISIETSTSNRVWSILLSWRGFIPRSVLWIGFVGLSTVGWVAWSAQLLGLAKPIARSVGIWLILGSAVPIGLLGSEWVRSQGSSDVVITGTDVIARTGPDDEVYEPVFVDGLQSGVEAKLMETRDEWNRLELGDGSQCWVPRTSFALVNP